MVRLTQEMRKRVITQAALTVARRDGLHSVTFRSVAQACSVTTSEWTVKHWAQTKEGLWRMVLAATPLDDPLRGQARDMGLTV